MTTKETLTRAAEILESFAAKATPGPWLSIGGSPNHLGNTVKSDRSIPQRRLRWIALMSPDLAAPLAAWLRWVAFAATVSPGHNPPWLELATRIVERVDGEVGQP